MRKRLFSVVSAFALALILALSPAQAFADGSFDTKSSMFDNTQGIEGGDLTQILGDMSLEHRDELSAISNDVDISDAVLVEDIATASIGIQPLVSSLYSWTPSTVAFNPSSMSPTDDIDIVWNQFVGGQFNTNYQLWSGYSYGAMIAKTAVSTQNMTDFTNYLNQGHVNDYFGARSGTAHTYMSFNSNPGHDTLTIFAGYKVRVRVYTSNKDLCFDSGYKTLGNYCSPDSAVPATYGSCSGFGTTSKDVFYLKVPSGNYYIAFSNYLYYPHTNNNIDTLDNGYYYAFYTGRALPALTEYTSLAHTSTVNWNGTASSTVSPIQSFTLSSSVPAEFAVKYVKFVDNKSVGSLDYSYADSASYEYQSPNSTAWRTINLPKGGTYTDNSPTSGSIVGKWQFRYTVKWRSNLAYVGASFSANTRVYIGYFYPYVSDFPII